MTDDVASKKVMTINGPIAAGDLGVTLTHEHLLVNFAWTSGYFEVGDHSDTGADLTMDVLGEARRDYSRFPTIAVVDDPDWLVEELLGFTELGGRSLVDVTVKGFHVKDGGFGQDADGLRRIAENTGLNIIIGCGYYVAPFHPNDMGTRDIDALEEEFVREITEGIGPTHLMPGVIGEIGMSQPVEDNEWKVLRAACGAQQRTGLPLYIHPYFGAKSRVAPEVVRFALACGVDPKRINACHMDGNLDIDYIRRVLDLGVYVSFDTFGLENYYDQLDHNYLPHDSQKEEMLVRLLDLGYESQLLISQDMCLKTYLKRYGGYGFGHLLKHIVPSLLSRGVPDRTIETLLVRNPARLLAH